MNFRVGMKVVCIDDSSSPPRAALSLGSVYTIRTVELADEVAFTNVRLIEIRNGIAGDGEEWSYTAYRFRPLVERKTDAGMAILKKILREAENNIPAEVS